jgi:glycosyltransferase involved in cell wall biosynthesis
MQCLGPGEKLVNQVEPTVSVVIIFLNAERFLAEAIDSVLAQTYPSFEILVVDDGSTDSGTEIAHRYTERFGGKVSYLAHEGHENRGMSASRNLGICHTRGKYVAFLDADDVWMPEKLSRQVAALESHPEADMVYGPVLVWFSWARSGGEGRDFVSPLSFSRNSVIEPPTLMPVLLAEREAGHASSVLVRRELLDRVGGFEERFRGLCEDAAFLAKAFLTARVLVTTEALVKYRQSPESCVYMEMQKGHYRKGRLAFLYWLRNYLHQQNVEDESIWRAFRKSLWRYEHPVLDTLRRKANSGFLRIEASCLWLRRLEHRARWRRGGPTGRIVASPRTIETVDEWASRFEPVGATTLQWTSTGTEEVQVRVGQSNGALLSHTGPEGTAATGNWVRNGMVFFLQNVSGGRPLTLDNTLDIVRVTVVQRVPARRLPASKHSIVGDERVLPERTAAAPSWPRVLRRTSRADRRNVDRGISGRGY